MRNVGGARLWLAAGYVLSLTIAIAVLYVGPFGTEPRPRGAADPPTSATARPTQPGPQAQASIPSDGEPVVYLVSIGGVPEAVLEYVADYVHSKHGLEVRLLPPSPPNEVAFDAERDQYITEVLLGGLEQQYPKSEPGDGSVVIGVLTNDVYILNRTDWAWAFGMRGDDGYAVVSTARMGSLEEPIDPIVLSRLRKMVLRNIGVLYFGLPLNDDPLSVLYRDVLGVDDLDRMIEEFCGSECPSRASIESVASLP